MDFRQPKTIRRHPQCKGLRALWSPEQHYTGPHSTPVRIISAVGLSRLAVTDSIVADNKRNALTDVENPILLNNP